MMGYFNTYAFVKAVDSRICYILEPSGPEARARVFVHVL